jgi:ATP-dependent RNA helicase DeaD
MPTSAFADTSTSGESPIGSEADLPSFAELGLPDDLLAAVTALGYTTPTYIQAAAIPPLLAGRDITGIAQTGTGKTAAFSLPLLAAVDASVQRVQAIVLTPTRELTIQVADAIEGFAAQSRGLSVVPIYGGASIDTQRRGLARGAQVVVGTPGRVIDLIERRALDLSTVRYVVLDEADEMLRMGFAEDVDQILGHVPAGRQVALFSATMPASIRGVARAHLKDPVDVVASRQASTVTNIEQSYAVVPFRHKIGALARVIATTEAEATIVFVRTRGTAEDVGSGLIERGIKAATISGEVAQKERERIVERLRAGTLDVLVATDVAARGLDVERIGLVVNFDLPTEPEVYVHRIGRTGRAGRSGLALSFVTPRELGRLRTIERLTRKPLTEAPIPSPADVSAHRARAVIASVGKRQEAGRLEPYRAAVAAFLSDTHVDPVELAAVLVALAVGDDGVSPRVEDIEPAAHERPGRDVADGSRHPRFDRPGGDERRAPRTSDRPDSRRRVTGTRYRVAVGHTHGARPEAIVGAITGEGGLRGDALGKIDIFPSFSLVEIATDLSPEASRRIGAARVAGRPLRIRIDEGPGGNRPYAGPARERY